jgi:tetraacyldisaccharide-1-P 4'-kinase
LITINIGSKIISIVGFAISGSTKTPVVFFLCSNLTINKDLFELEELKKLIIYEKNSSFYKAILQNLFFATHDFLLIFIDKIILITINIGGKIISIVGFAISGSTKTPVVFFLCSNLTI